MLDLTRDSLSEFKNHTPYEKAKSIFDKIIKHGVVTPSEMLEVNSKAKSSQIIDTITYNDFLAALQKMRNTIRINSLFYGAIDKTGAREVTKILQSYLSKLIEKTDNFPVLVSKLNTHKTVKGSFVYRTPNHLETELNNVILNLYQAGPKTAMSSLIMKLIKISWGNSFYYQLRTLKQLGYIVWSERIIKNSNMVRDFFITFQYFYFLVQGSQKTPDRIDDEIDTVINLVRDEIKDQKEEKLSSYKETLLQTIKRPDTNLSERSDKVWEEIKQNTLDFTYREKLIDNLNKIKKSDLLAFFDKSFILDPRKISIQVRKLI